MLFVDRRTGFRAEIDFRLFRRGDGGGLRRCVEDFYGDGYPYREYLDEEFLLEKIAAGDMTVLCGVTDKGEIVSTSALCMSREFRGSALLMLRVVKKAYRDMGIGKAQEDRLFQIAGEYPELKSLYADVMTHNSISQRGLIRRGLQKLEEYDGISILATNLKDNIDDAFKRRIKYMIPFRMPDAETRRLLWKQMLPKQAPAEEDLDLAFFAEKFELSGSEIKDAMLHAAYMAAAEGAEIGNRHVMEAVRLGCAKYGKVLTKENFGYMGV